MRSALILVPLIAGMSIQTASGGRVREGGDPAPGVIIFADPFDNYSQWAVNNGHLWQGGPVPAGDPSATYPPTTPSGELCDDLVRRQQSPSRDQYARQYWQKTMDCAPPTGAPGVAGISVLNIQLDGECAPPDDPEDKVTGTLPFYGNVDNVWGVGSYFTRMAQFTHSFKDRIQAIDPSKNGVNGSDEAPLILTFFLHDSAPNIDPNNNRGPSSNCYIDLSFADDRAPTDYIWRGNPSADVPAGEHCPEGPYPIVCQQVREININAREGQASQDEQQVDLDYLNAHCGPLQDKMWRSVAFGMLAIIDKEPCVVDAPTSHKPVNGRMTVFDGHAWRQIRDGRYKGLADSSLGDIATVGLPFPPENHMAIDPNRDCNSFRVTAGGKYVTLKITTDYILAYMQNMELVSGEPVLRAWHAAIPRAYKGAFNRLSFGVGPGCELDPSTGACKADGTPLGCLQYSTGYQGYWRSNVDNLVVFGGSLVYETDDGACCVNGTCTVQDRVACSEAGGVFRGSGTQCEASTCKGACCEPMGVCNDVNYGACPGNYRGIGSSCAVTGCPCPVPFADFDEDDDVDQDDFARFQACYNPAGMTPGCDCYDRNGDHVVSPADFDKFVACVTGPSIPIVSAGDCDD